MRDEERAQRGACEARASVNSSTARALGGEAFKAPRVRAPKGPWSEENEGENELSTPQGPENEGENELSTPQRPLELILCFEGAHSPRMR